jgi:sugar/nucleoside kinase (ribokinase family)
MAVALRAATDDAFEVLFVGVAGDDAAATIVTADLLECGVKSHIVPVAGRTGVVVALVSEGGERAMMTDRGVNHELRYEHVAADLDATLAHLHVSGYTALDARTRSLVPELLSAAAARGATSSIDVCSVGPLREVGRENFWEAASGATILFANEEEALALAQASDVLAALATLSHQWSEVVITRGAQGALASRHGETFRAAASTGDVLDTTGAGDSATGTYLAHRVAGGDVASALAHAMAAAAHVVAGLGSRP